MRTFEFDGNFEDSTPIDPKTYHRLSKMVAIDAFHFPEKDKKGEQYLKKFILRELNKAYVGFFHSG